MIKANRRSGDNINPAKSATPYPNNPLGYSWIFDTVAWLFLLPFHILFFFPSRLARSCMRTLVVFALGTQGDVRPLAIVAKALAHLNEFAEVVFFSHKHHQNWLSHLFHGSACRLAYTPTPPTVPLEGKLQTSACWLQFYMTRKDCIFSVTDPVSSCLSSQSALGI